MAIYVYAINVYDNQRLCREGAAVSFRLRDNPFRFQRGTGRPGFIGKFPIR